MYWSPQQHEADGSHALTAVRPHAGTECGKLDLFSRFTVILDLFYGTDDVIQNSRRYLAKHRVVTNVGPSSEFGSKQYTFRWYCINRFWLILHCFNEWRIYVPVDYRIIGSDNGLVLNMHQDIIWTNAGLLAVGCFGIYFSEILFEIQIVCFINTFECVVCKMQAI